MDPIQRIELVERMVDRLLDSGRIKDESYAREIAMRWIKGLAS